MKMPFNRKTKTRRSDQFKLEQRKHTKKIQKLMSEDFWDPIDEL
jgi:hypothetical protein